MKKSRKMIILPLAYLLSIFCLVACNTDKKEQSETQESSSKEVKEDPKNEDFESFKALFTIYKPYFTYPQPEKFESRKNLKSTTEGRIPIELAEKYLLVGNSPLKTVFEKDKEAFKTNYKNVVEWPSNCPKTLGLYPEHCWPEGDDTWFLTVNYLETFGQGDGFSSSYQFYLYAFSPSGELKDVLPLGKQVAFDISLSNINTTQDIQVVNNGKLNTYKFQNNTFEKVGSREAYIPRGYYQDPKSGEVVIKNSMSFIIYLSNPSAKEVMMQQKMEDSNINNYYFPNNDKPYRLELNLAGDTLTCTNPDETVQYFIRNHTKSKPHEELFRP